MHRLIDAEAGTVSKKNSYIDRIQECTQSALYRVIEISIFWYKGQLLNLLFLNGILFVEGPLMPSY
jgi:hypothetical protein